MSNFRNINSGEIIDNLTYDRLSYQEQSHYMVTSRPVTHQMVEDNGGILVLGLIAGEIIAESLFDNNSSDFNSDYSSNNNNSLSSDSSNDFSGFGGGDSGGGGADGSW